MKNKVTALLCVVAGLLHLVMLQTALHCCALPRVAHLLVGLLCFACAARVRNLKKYAVTEKPTPKKLEWY